MENETGGETDAEEWTGGQKKGRRLRNGGETAM